jgi:hypothetical protein
VSSQPVLHCAKVVWSDLVLIQVLIGFYWAGDMARQSSKIDTLVSGLEDSYGSFNTRLKDARVMTGLAALRRFYGWIAVVATITLLIFPSIIGPNQAFAGLASVALLMSILGWFSIKWWLDHKNTASEIGSRLALFIFLPLLIAIFDTILSTPFTHILADALYRIPLLPDLSIPKLTSPLAIGSAISALFAVGALFFYLLIWLMTAPIVFLSAVLIALPVLLARFIHTIAPRRAFVGLTFVASVVIAYLLVYT